MQNKSMDELKREATTLLAENARNLERVEKIENELKTRMTLDSNAEEPCKKPIEERIKAVFYPWQVAKNLKTPPPRLENGQIDYWAVAKMHCEKLGGHLPTEEDLAEIASFIYEEEIEPDKCRTGLTFHPKRSLELGLPENAGFNLWSGERYGTSGAYRRNYGPTSTSYRYNYRFNSDPLALCKG